MLYTAALVPAVRRSEPAVCVRMRPPSWASSPPVQPSRPGHRRARAEPLSSAAAPHWRSVWHTALCICQCYSLSSPRTLLSGCSVELAKVHVKLFTALESCRTCHPCLDLQSLSTHISHCLSGASQCSHLGDKALNKICKGRRARATVQRREEEKVWCPTAACSWEDPFRSSIRNTWGLKLTILKLK